MIGEISGLGCALCWAMSSILTKAVAGKFEPVFLNLLRCLGASLVLWAAIPFFPGIQSLSQAPPNPVILLVLSAVLGISLGDTIYIRGLKLIRVTLAFPIAQTSMPLLTVLAAVLFLDEKITWTMGLGTALILTGICLNAASLEGGGQGRSGSPKKALGIALVFLAAFFWAISVSLLKLSLKELDLILANGIRLPIAALALGSVLVWQKPSSLRAHGDWRDWAIAVGAGIMSFGVGGVLFLMAIHYAGVAKAAVLTTCAPLFGLPLSIWLLKERVTAKTAVGTVLAGAGIVLVL